MNFLRQAKNPNFVSVIYETKSNERIERTFFSGVEGCGCESWRFLKAKMTRTGTGRRKRCRNRTVWQVVSPWQTGTGLGFKNLAMAMAWSVDARRAESTCAYCSLIFYGGQRNLTEQDNAFYHDTLILPVKLF